MRMRVWNRRSIWFAALLAGTTILAVSAATVAGRSATSEPAPSKQAPISPQALPVVALGRLEPLGETLQLASPSGAGQNARVGILFVAEGDMVARGQILAELDNSPRLEAERNSAKASVENKELVLERARGDAHEALARRRLSVARADAELKVRESDLARHETLSAKGWTPPQILDQRRLERDLARQSLEDARAQLRRAQTLVDGEALDVAVAVRDLAVARAALRTAETVLEESRLRSPIEGRVLRVTARLGERPVPAGILGLGDPRRMTAIVEIYEGDAMRVILGASVEVRAPVFGDAPLIGTLTRVGLTVRRQSVVNADPTANTDARVIQGTILLDEPSSARAADYTRLQVRAFIVPQPPATQISERR